MLMINRCQRIAYIFLALLPVVVAGGVVTGGREVVTVGWDVLAEVTESVLWNMD